MIRFNSNRDSLMMYELLDESENIEEMNVSVEHLVDAFNMAIYDLCLDNDWDYSEAIHVSYDNV